MYVLCQATNFTVNCATTDAIRFCCERSIICLIRSEKEEEVMLLLLLLLMVVKVKVKVDKIVISC